MKITDIDNIILGIKEYAYSNNIYEVYSTLGISIDEVEPDSPILNNNDAIYFRDLFDSEIVLLKSNLNEQYKQFLLAHELGHAILHEELLEAAFNNKLLVKEKFEHEANIFALKFLEINFDNVEDRNLTTIQLSMKYSIPEYIIIKYFLK